MDGDDWDVSVIETIDSLFEDDVLEWENYIFINCHTDIIINDKDLIPEIYKVCGVHMDGDRIERLIEIMGIAEE
ncbi:hypothetical protein [Clostridium pasteurianum]|uniref:Uncharacterized protein n=1 Tax=Clostridium pasteurianum BC1 TaxID=86416 RepID=R4K4U9_CLOPA|nr:hypothetical protein [Clostridium pasteurianum]AGK97593.1 hypothetical protein Clopa_2753 [Clostridium pasteurianum BC1]